MEDVKVLILHGSPGSGKSTLANAISEQLRESEVVHAVLDLDELSRVYPSPKDAGFSRRGLKAIWPIYNSIPDIKLIMPTVITSQQDYEMLVDAVEPAKVAVCELIAPRSVLEKRVTSREPNEYWQNKLLKWVDVYHQRDDAQNYSSFQIDTTDKSVEDTARAIISKAGW